MKETELLSFEKEIKETASSPRHRVNVQPVEIPGLQEPLTGRGSSCELRNTAGRRGGHGGVCAEGSVSERDLEDAALLALKMKEEATGQGKQRASRSCKGQEKGSPLGLHYHFLIACPTIVTFLGRPPPLSQPVSRYKSLTMSLLLVLLLWLKLNGHTYR